ncbi:hypothetical protein CDAR_312041 [Caerostris darwini]|uniref:Uncharacterized protein n=1 Tax=Caerostris darwini TaxID=1538125 RepID=A0AAV4SBT2_9ARAC|nr:hypothetical protein CDAR_312041 [Caerostris darwini]
MTLWILLMSSLLFATTLASHNGYSDFESAGQNSGAHKPTSRWAASEDERSSYPYAQAGPLDLDAWPESDAVSLSRQIFGDKSSGEFFASIFPVVAYVVLQRESTCLYR